MNPVGVVDDLGLKPMSKNRGKERNKVSLILKPLNSPMEFS